MAQYGAAYRRYCWKVAGLHDLELAPFHVMASEDAVHVAKDHGWHMEMARRIAAASDGVVVATKSFVVDVTREESLADGVRWWEELTARGGEVMVVKPFSFVARGRRSRARERARRSAAVVPWAASVGVRFPGACASL